MFSCLTLEISENILVGFQFRTVSDMYTGFPIVRENQGGKCESGEFQGITWKLMIKFRFDIFMHKS